MIPLEFDSLGLIPTLPSMEDNPSSTPLRSAMITHLTHSVSSSLSPSSWRHAARRDASQRSALQSLTIPVPTMLVHSASHGDRRNIAIHCSRFQCSSLNVGATSRTHSTKLLATSSVTIIGGSTTPTTAPVPTPLPTKLGTPLQKSDAAPLPLMTFWDLLRTPCRRLAASTASLTRPSGPTPSSFVPRVTTLEPVSLSFLPV
mmetsp:Transcript_10111/g.16792  ORF Transcript_10111/g.16792 Transcript_10111/m.16792 type:complete len:202 (+) Transcript_10111:1253-1858(+)